MSVSRRGFLGGAMAVAVSPLAGQAIGDGRAFAAGNGAGATGTAVPLLIVSQGLPVASVVIESGADPQTRYAAQTLIDYVARASGATLPLLEAGAAATGAALIHIGYRPPDSAISDGDLGALGPDDFLMRRQSSSLTVLGQDGWGTRYGVYEFLERYVDVRWLMPDAVTGFPALQGADVPPSTQIAVPEAAPAGGGPEFIERIMYPYPQPSRSGAQWDYLEPLSYRREGMRTWGRFARLRHSIEFQHHLWAVIPPSVYGNPTSPDYRPDFFPLRGGQHVVPAPHSRTAWQPRFTADGIIEAGASQVLAYLRGHPGTTSYSLAVNDSGGYSEDEVDRDHLEHFGLPDAGPAYYAFVNGIAEIVGAEFPDVMFGVLAYMNVSDPPGFPLHHRVVPFLTRDTYGWVDAEVAGRDHDWVQRWRQSADQIGWWDYTFSSPYLLPRLYLDQMATSYRYLWDNNAVGVMAQTIPFWPEGPRFSVMSALLWDPDTDVPELFGQWCERAVGAAAAPHVQAYFRHWEDFWTQRVPGSEWFDAPYRIWYSYLTAEYLELVTDQEIADCRAQLDAAAAQPATPEQRGRLAAIADGFDYYEASALSYPRRTAVPTTRNEADKLLRCVENTLDRNIELAQQRMTIADALVPNDSWGPDRNHLVWSGWNLYAAWDLAEYLRTAGPSGQAIRRRVEVLRRVTRSEHLPAFLDIVDALVAGDTVGRGQNLSFEEPTLTPWVFTAGSGVVPSTEHAVTGSQSMLVPGGFSGRISQLVPAHPGFFRFEAKIFTPEAGDPTAPVQAGLPPYGYYAKLWARMRDDGGATVQQVVRQFSLSRAAGRWYQLAATELLDASVVAADCWIVLENTRDVWVDDVAITQLS